MEYLLEELPKNCKTIENLNMLDKIIQFLKSTDGYLSGEEISHSLNISREEFGNIFKNCVNKVMILSRCRI